MSSSDLTTAAAHAAPARESRFASAAGTRSLRPAGRTPRPTPSAPSRVSILLGSVGFGVVFLLAWQFLPPALGVPPYIIPTVTDLAHEFGRMVARENLLVHILSTVDHRHRRVRDRQPARGRRWATCWACRCSSRRCSRPIILGLQIAPKVAFAPLFIMWLGYNAWPKLIVTILVVFFPILVNVLQSMKTVDRDLINLARAYSMNRMQIFWKIEVPGLDAGADGGPAHRRDLGGDRRHRRRAGRRQYRPRLSHHVRRRPGQYRDGVQRHRAAHRSSASLLYGAVAMHRGAGAALHPARDCADSPLRRRTPMEHTRPIYPEIRPENVAIPKGQDLGSVAQFAHRALRDAQPSTGTRSSSRPTTIRNTAARRCATSAPAAPASTTDDNAVPAEHFTFSTMVLPAGCEGPLHLHTDAEEVFFILRGNKLRFIIEHQGERFETVLKERDLFSVPPGVYRGLVNEGIEEALMCVIIGNSKPVTPTYPPDHPLAKIKRPKGAGAG